MASIRYDIDPPEVRGPSRREAEVLAAPAATEGFDRELRSLYEHLLVARVDLVHGAEPAEGQPTLSRQDFDCVLAELDWAIVAARSMVAVRRMRTAAANGVDFERAHAVSAA